MAGDFAAVMGELDPPTFIVTAQPPGSPPAGCLVGFAAQCSIDPPRFLACLSPANRTHRAAAAATVLGVHLIPRAAADLARLFGGESDADAEGDKFSRCAWHPGPHAVPILDRCPNWFVGRIADRLELGDHVGFLLVPIAASHRAGHRGFGLQAAARIEPGQPA